MKIYEIIFSPTGGTKKVSDIFAEVFANELKANRAIIDLCDSNIDFSTVVLTKEDICIIAAPAYGGRVPATAIDRLKQIKGNQSKAILIAVYGNREFDDTLIELNDTAIHCNFIPIAGVGAIAEHSIVRRFAAKRPDDIDYNELREFSQRILTKLENKQEFSFDVPGNYPYKEYKGGAAKPVTDSSCENCGLCAKKCPVNAISPEEPSKTNTDICISCMRCISVCPNHSRQLSPEVAEALTQKLAPLCSERKQNTLYI